MKSRFVLILIGIVLLTAACSLDLGGSNAPAATVAPVEPTSAPVATTAPAPVVLFQDNFTNPSSGWEVGDYGGNTVGYKNGSYNVYVKEQNATLWGVANQSFTDVVINVDATKVSGPSNNNDSAAVYCRRTGTDKSDAYAFFVSSDGMYSIVKITGGSFTDLVKFASSSAIKTGSVTNHITVTCAGSNLTLAVNGTVVAQTTDSSYTTGDISLAATTYESTPTEYNFNNLVVTKP